jgi:prepilin-type N-terminal cleavage/methylation domain-containing protein
MIPHKIPLDKWKRNSLYLIYMKNINKGFTLIELLIVIALLGALAVGLLAALDPFEQLKKGTDTGVRNTTSEVQGGAIRFYALKNNMPWCSATDGTLCADPASASLTTINGGNPTLSPYSAIDQMATSGELKTNFVVLAGTQMDLIYVTGTNNPPLISVCFKPTSKSFQSDRNTKYAITGIAYAGPGTCKSAGGAVDCYWCIQ